MTSAKILLHSINPQGVEITTWVLSYWRSIHAEFMTHRAFSRNAASSRAIPVEKQLAAVVKDCVGPVHWGANERGMQANTQLTGQPLQDVQTAWRESARSALTHAETMVLSGSHKQIANRILEPFTNITVLMTTTLPALRHFFALRAHPDAQPEFQVLAYRMLDRLIDSVPEPVGWGEWHLPFGGLWRSDSGRSLDLQDRLKIATARCARISYRTHDGEINTGADLALYDRLAKSDPAHASAFEHCAQASESLLYPRSNFDTGCDWKSGSGWVQYRKTLPNEFNDRVSLDDIMARKPEWVDLDEDSDVPNPLTSFEPAPLCPPSS